MENTNDNSAVAEATTNANAKSLLESIRVDLSINEEDANIAPAIPDIARHTADFIKVHESNYLEAAVLRAPLSQNHYLLTKEVAEVVKDLKGYSGSREDRSQ